MVCTWSPLATAFNTRPTMQPILDSFKGKTGLFNKPELTSPEGFHVLKERAIAATEALIEEATSSEPTRVMVDIFDELSDTLCKVADLAEFVRIAHPQEQFSSAAEDACITVSGIVEKLNTHKGLYGALKESVANGTSGDQHLAELFLFDFEQSGIQLEDEKRDQVVRLNDIILQTGQRFMAGATEPGRAPRDAVPKNVRQFFSNEGAEVVVSGVYAECADSAAREAAYRLFLAPNEKQERRLQTALAARRQMAALCGFPSYAHRAIKGSIMETPSNVGEFLDLLSANLGPRAEEDFNTMRRMKRADSSLGSDLMCWDTPYYTQKARNLLLDAADSDLSPYFSLGACMEGLNMLCQELYGITLVHEEMLPGESWAPDVYKLSVMDSDNQLLGYVYCDLYERPGKPHQDCHFTIQGGKLLPDGTYQNPIVVIMLSLSGGPSAWGGPALLSAGAADNLYHEAGHALHSMLARSKHQHVAGTRCHTDLAELPSVLHEHLAASPQVVQRFARHFQTQQQLPERSLRRLLASKHLFAASEMQLQVFYSALDQRYHGASAGDGEHTTNILKSVQQQYYGLPYVNNTAWQHRFSHLIGYGAKYYSYLISRALAWTVWKKNFSADPLSRAAGDGLRQGVLKHGGSLHPRLILNTYLGTELTPKFLADALADELDHHKEQIDEVLKYDNKL